MQLSVKSAFYKIFWFIALSFLLQFVISYFAIRHFTIKEREDFLTQEVDRIKQDLIFEKGALNVTLFNTDPNTPTPNSTNPYPLYIITTDGFVIERSKPINGFLDTSDFRRLIIFNTPQTILTSTNEKFRVFSFPIKKNNEIIGVISVSYYNPQDNLLADIDNKLIRAANSIYTKALINGADFTLNAFDPRSIDYDVSYEVVNKFNAVLATDGRFPAYIDVSYVAEAIKNNGTLFISDSVSREPFLLVSHPFKDNNGVNAGIIVAGYSLSNINLILRNFLGFTILVDILIIFPMSFITLKWFRREIERLTKVKEVPNKLDYTVDHISFDFKECILIVNKNKFNVPYASNQYYLCKAIFSSPKKRWESDELLRLFGFNDQVKKNRTIYDAMLAVNKKVKLKLIISEEKTFRFNPNLLPYLSPASESQMNHTKLA